MKNNFQIFCLVVEDLNKDYEFYITISVSANK